MKKTFLWLGVFLIVFGLAYGCGKKTGSPKKIIPTVRETLEQMSLENLERVAKAYASQISDVKKELQKIKDELETLPPEQVTGEKGDRISKKVKVLTNQAAQLLEFYQIYAAQYQKKGGDVSKINIP